MADKVTLLDLSFNVGEAADGLDTLIAKSVSLAEKKTDLTKKLKAEEAALVASRKSFADNAIDQSTYEAAVNKSTAAIVNLTKQVNDNKNEITENNAAIKANTTIVNQGAKSTNGMRAQLALNTAQLNKMTEEQRLSTDEGRKLSVQTRQLSDDLKRLESGIGDNRRNVGNYAEDINKATSSMGGLSGATGGMVKMATGGIAGIKAFNAVIAANPFIAVVVVILQLINVVENMMAKNSELAASIKALFAPVGWLIDNILNNISVVFTEVVKVFAWVAENLTKLAGSLGLLSAETIKAIETSKQISVEREKLYDIESENLVLTQRQKRELESIKNTMADQTISAAERTKAAEKGLAIIEETRKREVSVLKAKYDQLEAEKSLNFFETKEHKRERLQALADVEAKEAEYNAMRTEFISQRSGVEKAASDKAIADQKARVDAAKKASEDLKKKREADEKALSDAQKKLQEETIKKFDQGITQLQLKIRERQIGVTDKKAILANQDEINQAILEKERFRLEKGLISQEEFDNTKLQMAVETQEKMAAIQAEQDAAQKEREALNLANRRDIEAQKITNEYEQRQFQLDQRYQQELANANKIGADSALVTQKYEAQKLAISKARANAELTMSADVAGQLSDMLGQESKAGKIFAIAQATINTYLGASKAIAQGGIWGVAQAAIVIAAGLKQVATISKVKSDVPEVSTNTRKYEKGGKIFGPRHSQGGVTFTGSNGQRFEAEGGENMYILNRRASGAINALSALNMEYGGKSFGGSNVYKYANGGGFDVISSNSMTNRVKVSNPDVNLSAKTIAAIAQAFVEGVENAPNPVVSVQDINDVDAQRTLIRESAVN